MACTHRCCHHYGVVLKILPFSIYFALAGPGQEFEYVISNIFDVIRTLEPFRWMWDALIPLGSRLGPDSDFWARELAWGVAREKKLDKEKEKGR